jgi:hypothetical protein
LNGRDHLEELGIGGKVILKLILKKCNESVVIEFISLAIWTVTGFCEYCNEPSDIIWRGEVEFL